jgi:hypothetical protein
MRKNLVWTLLLIPTILSMLVVAVPAPFGPPYLYVDPEIIWDDTMVVGTEFTVDIKVSFISPWDYLWAYQIEMYFNPSVLQCIDYEDGPFMESGGGNAVFVPGLGPDNTEGTIALFGAYLYPIAFFPYGEDGVLATITFEVVGEGASNILIGSDSALTNALGRQLPLGRAIHGLFCNSATTPEMYLRRRGAHGGGAWPEWHVGLYTEDQTLYATVMNYGEMGADIEVRFEVSAVGMPTMEYTTNEAWLDAATWVAEEIVPGEVTVSATFPTGTPGMFTVSGKLFIEFGGMKWQKVFYGKLEGLCGGEGSTRDIATKYKVVT